MRVASAVVHNLLLEDMTFKSTCLLIGPTGSGKTLIAKTLCKYFDIPYVKIDSTQLTQVGYQGANPDVFLERLLASANGDIKKAQKGIVLFDEIDKKATAKEDVSGKNVLDMLLLFMEGTTYDVTYKSKQIPFDTSELIILAAGSFESMVKKMQRKSGNYKDTKLGFQAELQKQPIKEDIVYPKITLEDLGKYGNLSSEFLGRIPVIVQLEGHTKESLIRVLTEPKCNILYTLRKVFQHFSVELQWTEGYLEKVAEEALHLKVGARSLNSVVERSVWEARDEVNNAYYDGINYSKVLLTENTVLDSRDCLFFDDTGNSMSLKTILDLREQSNQTLEKEKKIIKKM